MSALTGTAAAGAVPEPASFLLLGTGAIGVLGFAAGDRWPPVASDAGDPKTCGICTIDLTTGQVVALLRVETAVQEVFAFTVLPGRRYPDPINDDDKLLENSFTVPDAAPADVPAPGENGSAKRGAFAKA